MALICTSPIVIASQRVRPQVAGPMTGSAKQSRVLREGLDCFVASAPCNDEICFESDWTGEAMNPVDIRIAPREPWYKYGVAFLMFEIALAVAVSGYSLYMTFNGLGGFPGKH
jgi:hypothetical protein